MSNVERIKRLTELRTELMDIANSCAMDKMGTAGRFLHESANNIATAIEVIEGKDIPVPMDMVLRSMGL